jgi:VanZ family protein
MNKQRVLWVIAVVAWMALIYCFSDQPHSNEVTKAYFGDFNYWVRKGSHVTEYAILFVLSRRATSSNIAAFAISVLYACIDEWHQTFVPGRTGTPGDVLIDSIGPTILLAILAIKNKCSRQAKLS